MTAAHLTGSTLKASESPSYLFFSAPSVKENYYKPKFDELIKFYAAVVKKQAPGDRILITADAATIAEIGNRIPRSHLIEGEARDIWIRDHGVVQTREGIFKSQFRPNYMSSNDARYIENGFLKWFRDLEFPFTTIDAVIDGGNFCHNWHGRAVMTTRVLDDNPHLSENDIHDLAAEMGIDELAILPEETGDTTGHADGMIKWLSQNTIAVNNYTDQAFKASVEAILRDSFPGIEIVTMPWNPTTRYWRSFADGTGVYVNAVTTPNAIYVPVYGLRTDDAALALYREHADRRVIPVKVSPEIAIMGGAARCLSCQVYGEPASLGKSPGASRPRIQIRKPRIFGSRAALVQGRARSANRVSSVYLNDGRRAKRTRLRLRTGRWWLRTRLNSNRTTRLKVYAFDNVGAIAIKRLRIPRR